MAGKLLTEELALQLTEMLLQNDKTIRDDLQKKIDNISVTGGVSPTITLARTDEDDGVIITVTDVDGTESIIVYDGKDGINGKNAQVAKIEPIVGGNRVTFTYYDDSNTAQTSAVEIMNGKNGVSVASARIENGNELILVLSDSSEISAGAITIDESNLSLENYYDKPTIDQLLADQKEELTNYIDEKVVETVDEKVELTTEEDIANLF